MTPLLFFTAITLAIVSAVRSVLWLLSLTSPAMIDQIIAVLGGIGLTLGMYGLSARTALNDISNTERKNLNATIVGLLLISIYASFDWAESGFQAVAANTETNATINNAFTNLLADTRAISQNQQANADALTEIGHNSKSNRIASQASETIETRRRLINDLQQHQASNDHPSTGSSAVLLGASRFIIWVLLATLLDWTGMTAARLAAADSVAEKRRKEEEQTDPLLEQISAEIKAGDHGDQPAVVRVAKHHKQPDDRIRLIFQQLLQRGELVRPGIRYQRV